MHHRAKKRRNEATLTGKGDRTAAREQQETIPPSVAPPGALCYRDKSILAASTRLPATPQAPSVRNQAGQHPGGKQLERVPEGSEAE